MLVVVLAVVIVAKICLVPMVSQCVSSEAESPRLLANSAQPIHCARLDACLFASEPLNLYRFVGSFSQYLNFLRNNLRVYETSSSLWAGLFIIFSRTFLT